PASFSQSSPASARLMGELLHRRGAVRPLGRVNADEPHTLTALQKKRIAINHSFDNFKLAVGYGLIRKVKESGEKRNQDDTRQRPLPRATTGHAGPFSTGNAKRQGKTL